MIRRYRVTVTVEATFARKIRARAVAKEIEKRVTKSLAAPWAVADVAVRNRAEPQYVPPILDPREPLREAVFTNLKTLAERMAALLPNTKHPHLMRLPNRFCPTARGAACHTHTSQGRWSRIRKDGSWGPSEKIFGRICISNRWLDAFATTGHGPTRGYSSYTPVTLLAHEITHLRFPGGSHGRAKFGPAVEELIAAYEARYGKPSGPGIDSTMQYVGELNPDGTTTPAEN